MKKRGCWVDEEFFFKVIENKPTEREKLWPHSKKITKETLEVESDGIQG